MVVEVYWKQNCGWCDRVKEFLTNKNIAFSPIEVGNDITIDGFKSMMKPYKLDKITLPQVFMNNVRIGGFHDTVTHVLLNYN